MAKRRQRDVTPIASDLEELLSEPVGGVLPPSPTSLFPSLDIPTVDLPFSRIMEEITWLSEIDDARRYDPTVYHPKVSTGRGSKIAAPSLSTSHQVFMGSRRDPVLICARRSARREVLFAKRRMRGGGGGRRRRNEFSDVRC